MAPITSIISFSVVMFSVSGLAYDFRYRYYEPANNCDWKTPALQTWPFNVQPPDNYPPIEASFDTCNPAPPGRKYLRFEVDSPFPIDPLGPGYIIYEGWNCNGTELKKQQGTHCFSGPSGLPIGSFKAVRV